MLKIAKPDYNQPMADCCTNSACEIEKLRERQYGTLKLVLAINLVMFLVEMTAGILASSTALPAERHAGPELPRPAP